MKRIILLSTLLLLSKIGLCQLIIIGGLPGDTSKPTFTYDIDTIRVNGDTLFYVLSKFENDILIHREEEIFIEGETYGNKFHGKSEQWYIDGSKKVEGQFEFGTKKGLWKYWDEKGNLRQEVDREYFGRSHRGDTKFFIDGQPVEIREN
jgi:hypothetical protein